MSNPPRYQIRNADGDYLGAYTIGVYSWTGYGHSYDFPKAQADQLAAEHGGTVEPRETRKTFNL